MAAQSFQGCHPDNEIELIYDLNLFLRTENGIRVNERKW